MNRTPGEVQLYKSVAGGGWQQVGLLSNTSGFEGANRTTHFNYNYTFAPASLGKVNSQPVATIMGARDAMPATTPSPRSRRR